MCPALIDEGVELDEAAQVRPRGADRDHILVSRYRCPEVRIDAQSPCLYPMDKAPFVALLRVQPRGVHVLFRTGAGRGADDEEAVGECQ